SRSADALAELGLPGSDQSRLSSRAGCHRTASLPSSARTIEGRIMYKIKTYNQISVKGLNRFSREKYEVASEIGHPDAYILRSHKLHGEPLPETVKAVARAGAGVNNVPVAEYTKRGVVVFNSPGANANAVKELVLAGMLLASRGILPGMEYVQGLTHMTDAEEMSKLLEKEKSNFAGSELQGKILGVVGLGAIGSMIAETALAL